MSGVFFIIFADTHESDWSSIGFNHNYSHMIHLQSSRNSLELEREKCILSSHLHLLLHLHTALNCS